MAESQVPATNGDDSGLKVGIVGAGIAGLTTAIALLKAGHDVEVRSDSLVFLVWLSFMLKSIHLAL